MENTEVFNFIVNNSVYLVAVLAALVIFAYIMIFNLMYKLKRIQKRYRKMFNGVDGTNLERLLMGCMDSTKTVSEENAKLWEENAAIKELLSKSLTRIAVVRFRAFDDMGSDLSYAVAMLDSNNNGVIMSSIFARDDSRTYAKPVVNGKSSYAMTAEEEEALKQAMSK